MAPISEPNHRGPEETEEAGPGELESLSAPGQVDDSFPALTALAQEHPALLTQLRGQFFEASLREWATHLSDGEVLWLACELAGAPNLGPPQELVAAAVNNPYSQLACALAGNPGLTPPQELIAAGVNNPDSHLARALAGNPKLAPPQELVAAAVNNPYGRFACALAGNPNLTPSQKLVAAVRTGQIACWRRV